MNNLSIQNQYAAVNFDHMNLPWYAAVGDNGFIVFNKVDAFIDASQKLIWIKLVQVPTFDYAKAWAINEYAGRFYARNPMDTYPPVLPLNVAENSLFLDPNYLKREGGENASYAIPPRFFM